MFKDKEHKFNEKRLRDKGRVDNRNGENWEVINHSFTKLHREV